MIQQQRTEVRGHLTIALTGNPNSGKTTIFNHITGFRQRVANYPGVTVEKKEGDVIYDGWRLTLIDLPGIYSLTPHSLEELVTRRVILEEKPDVVVDVLDATNIERNLYLATQLKELGVPVVLALNMSDEARAKGIQFNLEKLSTLLGMPAVATVGHRKEGLEELLAAAVETAGGGKSGRKVRITYGPDVDQEIDRLERLVLEQGPATNGFDTRWLAIKLLEGDKEVRSMMANGKVLASAAEAAQRLEKLLGDHPAVVMADRRYGFISGACQEAVRNTVEARHTLSDRIDVFIMNDALGIPILLVMMYAVFHFTFTLGDPLMKAIEWGIGELGKAVTWLWPAGQAQLLESLLVGGIIGGVGGVIVFLPNIMLLFLAIAMLEDTGYMARAAFVMDRLMHKIGLHGKSFIPLLIGFGCNIPAIMATRTLENRRDRLVTMLIAPLMSCGARLTIYALIIPAFFPRQWQAPVLWMIYVTGILLAVLMAKLLSKTILPGHSEPFVMELPPYRMPTVQSVVIHMWDRAKQYLRKAGTIILSISIVLWALTVFPRKTQFSPESDNRRSQAQEEFLAGIGELSGRLGLTEAGRNILTARLAGSEENAADWAAASRHDSVWVGRFMTALVEAESSPAGTIDLATWRQRVRPAGVLFDAVSFYLHEVKAKYQSALARAALVKNQEQLAYSLAGRMGHGLEYVLKPLGLDWKIATALVGAFAAKEVFVAQMGIIYAVGDSEGGGAPTLRQSLRHDYSTLMAVCIMLFCLIGTPCMATLAVTRKESGGWGWAWLQWGGLTALAYLITLAVYQFGTMLGLGG
ncbi:MAG TPA: ferrous iron transport protein B [Candidatus Glassbacteria bacterium]|nr:ferrous iron transport protein B [Candidatus Glassbacteria bacterium]